jgi:transposase
MYRIGETVTEQLHVEVKAKVLQNVRFKYACRHCDRTGINAPMPTQPLPGSIATASTLAFGVDDRGRLLEAAIKLPDEDQDDRLQYGSSCEGS